ncbi:MAG: hypothetical protein H8D49_00380 [Dehalococcoidia bacterium]|nr:hypothetical protein [Dehalococcoidia bacterium]MBL7126421.1 hypothetical protein [Dehalococcoidales bacterium]
MKLWQGIILIILLLGVIPLSACEYLGLGGTQQLSDEQRKAYEEYNQKLREYEKQRQEYQQKVAEAYQEQLTDVYKEYSEGLTDYYEQRQKSIEDAIIESGNKTQ